MQYLTNPYLYLSIISYWYVTHNIDNKAARATSYANGKALSQKFKSYTLWDKCAEPFIIKQFGLVFGIGHSFVKGMISDNDVKIDNQLEDIIKENIE